MAINLGKNNPRVAEVRSALRNGSLTPDGLLPVEGLQLIREADRSGLEIHEIFWDTVISSDLRSRARVHVVDSRTFRSMQSTETSTGVIALVRPRQSSLEDLLRNHHGIRVVLCRLQDPGNVGTILRSSEAFGAAACIALQGTVSVYNSKVVRASAGSVFRLPHAWALNAGELFHRFRSEGIAVFGTSPRGTTEPGAMDWRRPCALLVGNEGQGLDPAETAACQHIIRIPHDNRVESLNSAIVTSIVLYEAWKQRT